MPQRGRSDPGRGSGPQRYPGTFLLAFREAVAGLGWQITRWRGSLVECSDAGGQEHVVGLENLYRRARRTARDEWPSLVTEFLRTVGEGEERPGLPGDLATAGEQLLVRIGQPLKPVADEARVWSQPLGETGLCINLVIDYPNRMLYVTEELVERSGKAGSEWLDQALTNLEARTPEDCFQPVHEESSLLLCGVADAYDASRSLILTRLLPETEARGCFVALPSRDELLVMPVTGRSLAHVHLLKLLADKNYRTSPYPISDQVYWIHRGEWRVFPLILKGHEVSIRPPDEFLPLLNELTEEAGEESDAGADEEA